MILMLSLRCLLEQYVGNDNEQVVTSPDDFNASLAMRQLLLMSGADPMIPSLSAWHGEDTLSVFWDILEESTDVTMFQALSNCNLP